jgi:hypothetical protein
MANACPLNFIKVDSNIARFSSLFVALLVLLYLSTTNVFILYFLAFDFVLKLFINSDISPIHILTRFLKGCFHIESKLTDGGAKKLAGFFGLFFVFLLILFHYFSNWNISLAIAFVFLSCSLLDVFFNFCIGCKIYYIIKKIYPNFMNNL